MGRNDAAHDTILIDHLNIALTLSKEAKNKLLTYLIEMAILEADPRWPDPGDDGYPARSRPNQRMNSTSAPRGPR
jgi:hypothetical protein